MAELRAQADARQVDTVHISASRDIWAHPGGRSQRLDSAAQAIWQGLPLSDWLGQRADIFIKSYGSGSLATSSIRGGGASHTALVWNGFSLQNPMNGQQDLSMLPLFLLDDVQVQFGSSSALYGSGAVGGAIHLNQQTPLGQGPSVRLLGQFGSFGQMVQGLDIRLGTPQMMSRTRLYRQSARHDFPVQARAAARQPHAHTQGQGLLQEFAWQPRVGSSLRAWWWAQEQDRQLPPTLNQPGSVATQADASQRIALQWEQTGPRWLWRARTALLHETLQFVDSIAAIAADNRSQTLIQEGEFRYYIGRGHAWQGGLNHTWQQAEADGFGAFRPVQQQVAAWLSYRYAAPRLPWTYAVSLRQGWSPGQSIPLTPDISLKGRLVPRVFLRAQAGRSFRLPTFNDRYWQPGGNLNLLPEQGWHQELGLDFKPRHWTLGLTGFHQTLDQWIQWRPGASYWFPENLRKVRSLGLEAEARYVFRLAGWQGEATGAYTWTQARSIAVTQARDASLGKQLIYTPPHQGRLGLSAQHKKWYATYGHTWTSRRYTSSDNAFFLPAYQVAHVAVQHRFQRSRWQASLGGRIDNLWNADFQVIDDRPMPPRNFRLTLSFHFHSKKTVISHDKNISPPGHP